MCEPHQGFVLVLEWGLVAGRTVKYIYGFADLLTWEKVLGEGHTWPVQVYGKGHGVTNLTETPPSAEDPA